MFFLVCSVTGNLCASVYLLGAICKMAKWRCLTVAGAPAWITDHSCSEAEGNIGAQSKSPTLGIGALATNSEGRCHNQASPVGMLRADSCVIPGNIAGRTDYCLEDLMSEDGGELTQIRQTSKPSIMWTQFPLLTWFLTSLLFNRSMLHEWPSPLPNAFPHCCICKFYLEFKNHL